MRIFVGKREVTECAGDTITMVVVRAHTVAGAEVLLRDFNTDKSIRTSGGAPLDMEGPEWEWSAVGNAFEADAETPKLLHYVYNR